MNHSRDYHLFFQMPSGTPVGQAFGPVPQVGWTIEVAPHGDKAMEWLVMGVKLHAGDVLSENVPHITTVTVIVGKAESVELGGYAAQESVPMLYRRAAVPHNERKIALAVGSDN